MLFLRQSLLIKMTPQESSAVLVLDLAEVHVVMVNLNVLVLVLVMACPVLRHGGRIVLV